MRLAPVRVLRQMGWLWHCRQRRWRGPLEALPRELKMAFEFSFSRRKQFRLLDWSGDGAKSFNGRRTLSADRSSAPRLNHWGFGGGAFISAFFSPYVRQ